MKRTDRWPRTRLALLVLLVGGCAARADPLQAEGKVVKTGPGAPVARGSRCTLRLWPAWRQGVNCQLLLRCAGHDLFGGKRIGGYAVCDTEAHRFTRAKDDEVLEDPALDIDLRSRRIRWRDRHPDATLEIALSDVRTTPGPGAASQ